MSNDSDAPRPEENYSESAHLILQNLSILKHLTDQLKEENRKGEDQIKLLNVLSSEAENRATALHNCVDSLISVAEHLAQVSLAMVPPYDPNFHKLKAQADKLLTALNDTSGEPLLEGMSKGANLSSNIGVKCLNVYEKYPEHYCSRESLLEMNSVIALPPVPEDAFADFNRPVRTKSSGSIKNLRRVKMCFMQRMSDDESDENEGKTAVNMKNKVSTVNKVKIE